MNNQQRNAKEELETILEQLNSLGEEARDIMKENFPHEMGSCNAYRVFDMGWSCNPYDTTLAKVVEHLEIDEFEDDDPEFEKAVEDGYGAMGIYK